MSTFLLATKIYKKLFNTNFKLSFSQCGEDSILLFLVNSFKWKNVQYFDFGTNNPIDMNNTYLLYLNGHRGVCIEPDPYFHDQIRKRRPKDILIPAGISNQNVSNAEFYLMDDPVLNTFSKSEAYKMVEEHRRKIKKVIKVPLLSVNEIFKKYYEPSCKTIVSLDVEGLDLEILKTLNFSLYKPDVICVETLEYSEELKGQKNQEIINLLSTNNYILYADTYINSIFIHNSYL